MRLRSPGRGPWWISPPGVGGRGVGSPPHRMRRYREPPTLPGHDETPERTGRALTECPPTRITTVFRGGGLLTADRSIVPETDVRLLNWTVSSRVSIPNVRANGASPPRTRHDPQNPRPRSKAVRGDARVWRRDAQVSRSGENRSVIAALGVRRLVNSPTDFVKEVRNMRCNSPLPQMEDISITAPLPS